MDESAVTAMAKKAATVVGILIASVVVIALVTSCSATARRCQYVVSPHPSGRPRPAGRVELHCDGKIRDRVDADNITGSCHE